jgi:hypothetical protein
VCSALFDVSAFAHAGRSIRTLATTDSFLSADAALRRLILLSVRTIGVRPDISIATAYVRKIKQPSKSVHCSISISVRHITLERQQRRFFLIPCKNIARLSSINAFTTAALQQPRNRAAHKIVLLTFKFTVS